MPGYSGAAPFPLTPLRATLTSRLDSTTAPWYDARGHPDVQPGLPI